MSLQEIELIRDLGLTPVLGSAANVAELLDLLTLIERTDFRLYPEEYRNREKVRPFCLGRNAIGAEYVLYCSYARRLISLGKFRLRRQVGLPVIPHWYPRGWNHEVVVLRGWEGALYGGGGDGTACDSGRYQRERGNLEDSKI